MRWREARSSAERAASTLCASSASSAARRSVMSNSAPSSHSRPPGPGHGLAAVEHPAHLAVGAHDPVLEHERLAVLGRLRDRLEHDVDVVGVDDREDRALGRGQEVGRRVARDPLDLVADRLQHEVVVPGRAVDRARHVLHQRPQQAVVGALLGGAQAGARAGDQLRARERAVQVVVGARVEHRVGHPALRGDRDRQQPGVPQARIVAQQAADRGRVEAGGVTVDDDQVDLFGLELGDRPRRHAEPPAGHAPRRGARTGSPAPRRPPRAPRPDAGEQLLLVPLTALSRAREAGQPPVGIIRRNRWRRSRRRRPSGTPLATPMPIRRNWRARMFVAVAGAVHPAADHRARASPASRSRSRCSRRPVQERRERVQPVRLMRVTNEAPDFDSCAK